MNMVEVTEPKLFGKYSFSDVKINEPGLDRYINLTPMYCIHTMGKHANKNFAKHSMNIVERLINNLMRHEQGTGKKYTAYNIVKKAFDLIYERTNKNPLQVFVEAIENSAPREETTMVIYGGVNLPRAVDTSSARRVDLALRHIAVGALQKSYRSNKKLYVHLAEEIISASKDDKSSYAISKKYEIEKIAESSR